MIDWKNQGESDSDGDECDIDERPQLAKFNIGQQLINNNKLNEEFKM